MLTARELINQACNMIGVVRYGETIGGDEMHSALQLLNQLLASFAAKPLLVPFIEEITFIMTANKGIYKLGREADADVNSRKLVQLTYAAYVIDGITFPIHKLSKNQYNELARIDSLPSYPLNVLLQNSVYSSILTFYPQPNSNYTCVIKGKFAFDKLELDDRLDEIPEFYQRFLCYMLARELGPTGYGKDLTPGQLAICDQLEHEVKNASDLDLTLTDNRTGLTGAAAVRSGLFLL